MNRLTQSDHVSEKRVVYTISGMEAVRVLKDQTYRVTDAGTLTMDLYYPSDSAQSPRAAVILVTGFPDKGVRQMVGCARARSSGKYWGSCDVISAYERGAKAGSPDFCMTVNQQLRSVSPSLWLVISAVRRVAEDCG